MAWSGTSYSCTDAITFGAESYNPLICITSATLHAEKLISENRHESIAKNR
jgi:hypothetical protein